jgi:integrin beta 3
MDKKIKQLLDLMRAYVKDALTPLADRIHALEKRQPERGEKGEPGTKGIDGEKGTIGDRGEPGLDGKDGRDGIDGKDGAPGRDGGPGTRGDDGTPGKDGAPGRDGVDGKDGLAAAAGVDGKDGIPGERGADGKDGAPGLDGKDGAAGRDGIDGKDGAAGERGADGKDGVDGKEGQPGRDAVDGKDGKEGAPGVDGKSVVLEDVLSALDDKDEARFAKWALGVERRVYDAAEKAIAAMPVPKDGVDGLRVEDLQLVGRTLQLKSGDQVLKSIVLPMPVYRGVFDDGETYDVHDMVTFGGSVWVAVSGEGIRGKPGTVDAWKLAVKKGRDGRDARTPA